MRSSLLAIALVLSAPAFAQNAPAGDVPPKDVKDDWGVVVTFAEKAKAAGSDRVELAKLSKETGAVMTAYKNISSQAKDSCKVDLPALN